MVGNFRRRGVDANSQLLLLINLDRLEVGGKGGVTVYANRLHKFVRRHLLETDIFSECPRKNSPSSMWLTSTGPVTGICR